MKKRILLILLFIGAFIVLDRSIGYLMNSGLNRYFGLDQPAEILVIGHSHLMLATDKQALENETGKKVSKYCREGVNVVDRYAMVKQCLASRYSDSLKIVLYGVDQFIFNGKGLSQNSYKLFYPFIDDADMNSYIRESTSGYDYLLRKLICTSRYSDALINSAIRGWRKDWSNYKEGTLDTLALKKQVANKRQRKIHFEQPLIDTFEATLQLLNRKGIKVVLVNTPIARMLNEAEPDTYQTITTYFQSLADSSPLIEYWDMNPAYSGNYELFFDAIHLNPLGQKTITKELIQRLKQ